MLDAPPRYFKKPCLELKLISSFGIKTMFASLVRTLAAENPEFLEEKPAMM